MIILKNLIIKVRKSLKRENYINLVSPDRLKTSTASVEQASNSKIAQVDFNNLPFGAIFTDHMMVVLKLQLVLHHIHKLLDKLVNILDINLVKVFKFHTLLTLNLRLILNHLLEVVQQEPLKQDIHIELILLIQVMVLM